MEEDTKKVILTISATVIFLICWVTSPALSQNFICAPSEIILHSIQKQFGERVTERGIEEQNAMLVVITVNSDREWSLLISPKSEPTALCSPVTGRLWTQQYNKSSGIAFDGSVITVNFDENGIWRMYYLDNNTGNLQMLMQGYNWEGLWKFDKSL